ncbi:MAG: Rne/Rng family ribonuclease [Acidimicrobiales bacterium]
MSEPVEGSPTTPTDAGQGPASGGDTGLTDPTTTSAGPATGAGGAPDGATGAGGGEPGAPRKRRRGSRGGRGRNRSGAGGAGEPSSGAEGAEAGEAGPATTAVAEAGAESPGGARSRSRSRAAADAAPAADDERPRVGDRRPAPAPSGGTVGPSPKGAPRPRGTAKSRQPDELPERLLEGRPKTTEAAEKALVKRPQIGDTRPAPEPAATAEADEAATEAKARSGAAKRRRGGRSRSGGAGGAGGGGRGKGGREAKPGPVTPVEAVVPKVAVADLDEETAGGGGRQRKGRPVGRYLMVVSVSPAATQIAVLEGRNLIEHYVSRPADDVSQIHGNIYLGRVQNVLPGMEAAFVDIGTPKNAVLYRGDVQYDAEDIEEKGANPRIEQLLKPRQSILCQVTKNPIAHKGARLTQEVSLPGRFVVLIPNSTTYGISKRLADDERKRLRQILDKVRPKGHGIIVRTAAEGVSAEEIERDVLQLLDQWEQIDALAKSAAAPTLLYREPDMAVRVIREEFNDDYRGIVIDDPALYEEVRSYVAAISPTLADRVQLYDRGEEPLTVFERYHVHEQLHKALDRKVWLPSGGSLIIEHTEALTVIDVNTGKNVGSSSLEETVFKNNLEAADEIAKQLRLRDIGGIIVCDFIDMEIRENRDKVIRAFRDALARDKTRTQVFDISELGLVEMTRKRIGEGLLESFSSRCPECDGRGLLIDRSLLEGSADEAGAGDGAGERAGERAAGADAPASPKASSKDAARSGATATAKAPGTGSAKGAAKGPAKAAAKGPAKGASKAAKGKR